MGVVTSENAVVKSAGASTTASLAISDGHGAETQGFAFLCRNDCLAIDNQGATRESYEWQHSGSGEIVAALFAGRMRRMLIPIAVMSHTFFCRL